MLNYELPSTLKGVMEMPPKDRDTHYTENGDHRTWYDGDRNSRISWDVDQKGDYVPGSGHEVDQNRGRTVDRWDTPDKK